MKIQVGDQFFDIDHETTPVAIYLSDEEKVHIATMNPECHAYGLFPDAWDEQVCREWLHAFRLRSEAPKESE